MHLTEQMGTGTPQGGHSGTQSGAGSKQSPQMPPRHGAHTILVGEGELPTAAGWLCSPSLAIREELDPENNKNQFKSNEI